MLAAALLPLLQLGWPASPSSSPRLMASLPRGAVAGIDEELNVTEDLADPDAPIVFTGPTVRIELSKGRGEAQLPPANSSADLWGGNLSAVIGDPADVLGNLLLANGTDPCYADVAALVPPIISSIPDAADFSLIDGQTFIGSRLTADKRSFSVTGDMHGNAILQANHLDPDQLREQDGKPLPSMRSSLLGGFLPAPRWHWQLTSAGTNAEQIAFALPESTARRPFDTHSPQPVWIRYLNVSLAGEMRYVHYVDTYENYPDVNQCHHETWKTSSGGFPTNLQCSDRGAVAFYTDLLSFARYWNHTFESEGAMELELPEHGIDVAAFARSSLIREMITRRGMFHPRYGAPPLYYGTSACCDGFQDTFVAAAAAFLEHGLMDTAKGIIDTYYTYYVRRGAVINVRGPEMAQFGRMLTVMAQYYRYSNGDASLLLKHEPKVMDIQSMLMRRHTASLLLPSTDPSRGIIRGIDEADELFVWTEASSELPHISMNLEAWRGFRDLSTVWSAIAETHSRPDLALLATALSQNATTLKRYAERAISMSAIIQDNNTDSICNPYVAGERTCGYMGDPTKAGPGPFMHPNRRASEPFRSYSGMFFSGGISTETAKQIQQYNQHHLFNSRAGIWGGGCVSTVQMAFTEQGHGYGLVQHGMIEPFLLQLYAEMAHVCSRGTWTCFESRSFTSDTAKVTPSGGYASPAQMVVPLHAKFMLVFEDPITSNLQLCKAIPRSWLQTGERVAVRQAPTSWGRVSLALSSQLATTSTITANVTLPAVVASSAASASPVASLFLRAPGAWEMSTITANGKPSSNFDAAHETVTLTWPKQGGRVVLEVRYTKK
eukprot:SAG31_NODE_1381_length_8580_cov_5.632590_5_plen_834_part_00